MIGAGALVVALIIWAVLVSPQNSKLASLQTQETQLQNQATGLQIKLASLKTEQQKLSGSCADLQKIATQIPSVQTPTDIDAEESSFEGQFNALTASSGVQLTQFSGFAPATSTSAAPASTGTSSTTPSDVTAVPTTLAVTGTFGQMSAFINGLDSFPRLFVIQSFVLSYGTNAATSSSGSSSSSSSSSSSGSSGSASGPPLWTGGVATASGAAPYSLSITGSIYYTSTPSALDACTKATAATTAAK
jgi:Tfp pilus assembly protein PilO